MMKFRISFEDFVEVDTELGRADRDEILGELERKLGGENTTIWSELEVKKR